MKEITEKQIEAIKKLARATKTEINGVEQMSSFEASKVIEGLIEKLKEMRKNNRNYGRQRSNGYSSDALAGLAVKIVAQRHDVKTIIGQKDRFKQRVAELYSVFSEARQVCRA